MDFYSDLYCYEDVSGGWTTHVAGMRQQEGCPHTDMNLLMTDAEAFWKQYKEQQEWLETVRVLTPIGLPHAGETFNDPTLEAFRDRLLLLREIGYRFPDEVLERIAEEIDDRDADA